MDPYTGEIRIFAGNYAPAGWALCNGQLLQIRQYSVLFSILGNQYGGDGRNTFALPNLMGKAPMHQGQGHGLSHRTIGEEAGTPVVTLLQTEMPTHNHIPQAANQVGDTEKPSNHVWAQAPKEGRPGREKQEPLYNATANAAMSIYALQTSGGTQPHNNMQPYLVQNYIICLNGIFPSRG
ncbi:tail fiber protein [Paenibacillus sp. SC116]|uniref:phage tail protein n=1 Tax=Paenibacillus sp. SC116 TaxID=2968986 RepID=UPI00215B51B8|nr:tail fiber protein [Paenibacillus sp. SC116]MCR8846363.1 tail fiber protein [Paenibacillus sp. SC116]